METAGSGSFTGKLSNVKVVANVLKTIHFKDLVNVSIATNGIEVTVEASKTFQANAFFPKHIFAQYDLFGCEISFSLNLPTLIECINLLGFGMTNAVDTALVLQYSNTGDILKMWLEDDGVISEASIPIGEPCENVAFNFATAVISAKVILMPELSKEVFNDLDMSSEKLLIHVCPDSSMLTLSTFGHLCDMCFEIPASSDMVAHFSASQTIRSKFCLSLLKHAFKPLPLSERVSLRLDHKGLLCLQYMIKYGESSCFVEFYSVPDQEDEEDEEDEGCDR